MFRAPDVGTAFTMYGGMFGLNGLFIRPEVEWQISHEALTFLVIAIGVAIAEPYLAKMDFSQPEIRTNGDGVAVASMSLVQSLGLAILAVLTLMKLAEQTYSPFLYFQF
jgi:alginate O-acetyltransferase complex protein AlgI